LDGGSAVARPLSAHRIAQTQNKRTQTSMPQVGFESTISVFERAKTVHASGRAATVTGIHIHTYIHTYIHTLVRSLSHVFKLASTVYDDSVFTDLSQCQINVNKIFGTCSANELMIF
jgi:hypothetical protein